MESEMTQSDELPETLTSLSAALGLDTRQLPTSIQRMTLDDVLAFVAVHVDRLLKDSPGLLMSILYRIDVPERRVRDVFESAPYDNLAVQLADLMIERELQKVRTRRDIKYTGYH